MRNILKKSLFLVTFILGASLSIAQTTVTWIPTAADVTALTNTSVHVVNVGSGSQSFQIYSTRPFFNNNEVKLAWDASANAVKMTDNGMDKAGIAIYVPTTSDDISNIVVYMHTSNSRKTLYASGNPCPNSGTVTSSALAKTSTGYTFWNETFVKDKYYVCGGRSGGSGDSYYDKIEVVFAGPAPASSDATLSALTYNGTSVPSFDPNTTTYDVELPTGTTTVPTVVATKNDSKASDPVINPASSLPGATTVTVTAEDGTTTKTYTITFTVASSAPKVTSATWDNIKGTATIDQVNKTITGQVIHGSSLSLTPSFTGNNIASCSPDTEQNFANGAVNYTFKSSTNETTVYAVTITEAPAVSTDATLSGLTYGGKSVPNFSPNTLTYNIELTAGIKTPPTIAATPNNRSATVQVTQAQSVPGSGKVEVTAEDGETKLTYTINYIVEVPSSGLTIHEPEIYEAKEIAGGYGGTLSVFGGREYEVYFLGRDDDKNAGIFTKNGTQIGTGTSETELKIDWLSAKSSDKLDGQGRTGADEFAGATGKGNLKMKNGDEMLIHIKGFDQFTLWAKDNNTDVSKGKYMYVYIDDVEQPVQNLNSSDGGSLRRYDISTGEHVIKVTSKLDGTCKPYGFSLRLAQEPRTKYLKGNDSTQTVLQTTNIKPITYVTKYNNIPGAQTRLVWDGYDHEATGIDLTEIDGSLCDTLVLSGQADCPVGEYNYHVIAYYNGVETNRVSGKFKVVSSIAAKTGVNADAYTGEEMDQIIFTYYAQFPEEVILTWPNGQPDGISGSGANGKYIIGGTPTATGTFPYSITTQGGDTTIQGKIVITAINYGPRSVLYLYKNDLSYEKDAVYQYLNGSGDKKWDLIYRKQKEDGNMRPTEQYANYKWILISEDVDANNPEIIGLIRGGGANLPILNLKGFTYSSDRLDWGEPDNGAIDTTKNTKVKGTKLYIQQPNHPLFKEKMTNLETADPIQVLSN